MQCNAYIIVIWGDEGCGYDTFWSGKTSKKQSGINEQKERGEAWPR